MNSKHLMPFDAIAKNVIKDAKTGISYLSGTGFFVYFPPFENQVFYITSRHCLKNLEDKLYIEYASFNHLNYSVFGKIEFSKYIELNESENELELEDVIICVVSEGIAPLKKQVLLNRALKLAHVNNVDAILDLLASSQNNGKVRIIGFPEKSETELIYNENYEVEGLKMQPRGLNGWLKTSSHGIYDIVDTNWTETTLKGFSGSPVLAICPNGNGYTIVVLGIVIAADENKKIVRFISINSVTQAIAEILYKDGYCVPIEPA